MQCSETYYAYSTFSPFEYLQDTRPFLECEGMAIVPDFGDPKFWLLERIYTGYFLFDPQVRSQVASTCSGLREDFGSLARD